MSARPPSDRVAEFVGEHRDGAVVDRPRRPIRRLLLLLVGIPGLLVAAFFLYMLWAVSACGCTPPPSYPPSPVDGVVVGVDSAGLGKVRSFELRLPGGSTLHIEVGNTENPTEFPPGHLAEHQASSSPVRVWFRVEGGGFVLVAYRLEDAPDESPAAT